jgi:hypothetical protein
MAEVPKMVAGHIVLPSLHALIAAARQPSP